MADKLDTSHHIKAVLPALEAMEALGFAADDCLRATGLNRSDLGRAGPEIGFTLDQEFQFHRNLLALSDNPLLGLLLGRSYQLESYGLLGYAFLSAPTLRQALIVLRNYGPLTFSLFRLNFLTEGGRGVLRLSPDIPIPDDLHNFYVDRDLSAAIHGSRNLQRVPLEPQHVQLMHNEKQLRELYQRHFGCPVSFSAECSELHMDGSLLDIAMPLGDSETSAMCQQQCRQLLARMRGGSNFVDKVRRLILARPGYFPDVDYVAERLNITSRTLRRRLSAEGSSYQEILAEIRYQLACEYLATSTLPLEEISNMLGYSAPGNFSNAFKRWHGCSPREFRQESRQCG